MFKRSINWSLAYIFLLSLLFLAGAPPIAGDVGFLKLDEAVAVDLMLQEINRLRVDEGLVPLTLVPALSEVCREHSKDMANEDYFGHISPDNLGANARVRHAGLNCLVGENIGVYRTQGIPLAHIIRDLMGSFRKSKLHRANILNPEYTHVGLGFFQNLDGNPNIFGDEEEPGFIGGYGVVFVTQNFYRLEISRTEPSDLPAMVATGEEFKLSIKTLSDFNALSLRFERDGFFTEEYLVRVKPTRSREYNCVVRFAEKGRWACKVIGICDPVVGQSRGIGQMEFLVQ